MFSLQQLTGFVAVAEELHFGRAAERLRMTQPPLSRQVRMLENELGVTLLERDHRVVRLTKAGRLFLGEARRLLRQADEAARTAWAASVGDAGSLGIGFTAASAYRTLGKVLEVVRSDLPGIELLLREMGIEEQLEGLSEGRIDVGLLVRPPVRRQDFESRTYGRESLVAAVPVGHPFAQSSRPLTAADFDGQDFIMYLSTESRYFHDHLIAIFEEADCAPVFTHHLGKIHSVLALVNAGFGLTLVPESATQLRYPEVVFKPFDAPDSSHVRVSLVWRRSNDNPVLHALISHLW